MNYAFYDPELHWCKTCNVFPKTAKDYLNHLHSKEHADVVKKNTESPWHDNNPNVVSEPLNTGSNWLLILLLILSVYAQLSECPDEAGTDPGSSILRTSHSVVL